MMFLCFNCGDPLSFSDPENPLRCTKIGCKCGVHEGRRHRQRRPTELALEAFA